MAAKSTKNNKKGNSKNNKKVSGARGTAARQTSGGTDIHGVIGIVLFCLGILMLACQVIPSTGTVLNSFKRFMYGIGGGLCLLLPVLICWSGIMLVFFSDRQINLQRLICIVLLFFLVETILQIFNSARYSGTDYLTYLRSTYRDSSMSPQGGGFLGALLAWPLYMALDVWGSVIVLLFTIAIVLVIMTGISLGDFSSKFTEWHEDFKENREMRREEKEAIREAKEEEKLAKEAELALERRKKKEEKAQEEEKVPEPPKKKKEPVKEPPTVKEEPIKLSDVYAELDKEEDAIPLTEQFEPISKTTKTQPATAYTPKVMPREATLYIASEDEFSPVKKQQDDSRGFTDQQAEYEFMHGLDTRSPYARPESVASAGEENNVVPFPQQEMEPSKNGIPAISKNETPDLPVKDPSWVPEDSDLSYGPENPDSLEADEQPTGYEPRVQPVETGRFEPEYPPKELGRSAFQYQAGNIGRADTSYQMPQNPEVPSEPTFVPSPAGEPEWEKSPSFIEDEPAANERRDERMPVTDQAARLWNAETHKEAPVEIQTDRQNEAANAGEAVSSEPAYTQEGGSSQNRRRRRSTSGGTAAVSPEIPVREHPTGAIPASMPARGFDAAEQQNRGQTPKPVQPTGEQKPVAVELREKRLDGTPMRIPSRESEHDAKVIKPVQEYIKPDFSLLNASKQFTDPDQEANDAAGMRKLLDTLESFGVQAKALGYSHGPAITRYEIQPAPGVKVSRIVNLVDDIALNMASTGVRIEAPIPGKAAVGIEVPNASVSMVTLRDVLDTPEMAKEKSPTAVALGKGISGKPIIADMAKMPHVLIAGATGSGKSVCINTIINSIIFRASPEEVRMILVDPKVVELSVYNGIPHLLIPVVTDCKKASAALDWAVVEMEHRYKRFESLGVRDIRGYNAAIGPDEPKMYKIIVIIDELADLMMVAPGEVEESICRLAQLARAAGIHLVIATQRPSVNVITGVIKANIPSRIAFAVSSQIDSRTILDAGGAEKLLGKGDMLYAPQGALKPTRVQGCFVSDEEVERIVEFVKTQHTAEYVDEITEKINTAIEAEKAPAETENTGNAESKVDDMLDKAIELAIDAGQVSISMLQRRLRVGYARAGRLVDEMTLRGITGEAEGPTKPRQVLITREDWKKMKEAEGQ
ncbi:MAG: DNA translocase FtsK 4TM domain-containing protein [Clostridia bacterium]|nr:DNA translocase FtsK 4TM domain-containing protein [Clostridia bacterium]